MGNINGHAMLSNGIQIIKFAADINPIAGIVLGLIVFAFLIIIAGFFVLKYMKNDGAQDRVDADRILGCAKGIVRNISDK